MDSVFRVLFVLCSGRAAGAGQGQGIPRQPVDKRWSMRNWQTCLNQDTPHTEKSMTLGSELKKKKNFWAQDQTRPTPQRAPTFQACLLRWHTSFYEGFLIRYKQVNRTRIVHLSSSWPKRFAIYFYRDVKRGHRAEHCRGKVARYRCQM